MIQASFTARLDVGYCQNTARRGTSADSSTWEQLSFSIISTENDLMFDLLLKINARSHAHQKHSLEYIYTTHGRFTKGHFSYVLLDNWGVVFTIKSIILTNPLVQKHSKCISNTALGYLHTLFLKKVCVWENATWKILNWIDLQRRSAMTMAYLMKLYRKIGIWKCK